MQIAFTILAGVAIWILAYFRASLPAWTGMFALLLSLWMFASGGFTNIWWFIWLLMFIAALMVNLAILRRTFLMKPLFLLFRRTAPLHPDRGI
jgi:hypothetical protein